MSPTTKCQKRPITFRQKHYKDGELSPDVKKLLADTYVHNEIIVFFPKTPTDIEVKEVEETLLKAGIKITKKIKCDKCDIPIQLWQGLNAHTIVNADTVRSGAGPTSTKNVGEEYSLNYKNWVPAFKPSQFKLEKAVIDKSKKRVLVAVLDTGVDKNFVDEEYFFKQSSSIQTPCYPDVLGGWDFTTDANEGRIGNANFSDDNAGRHGTLVTQFIINEFKRSKANRVEILPLKTHNKNGIGDLFRIICAIHFAIAKKVDIINASWGLYYYDIEPIPYLKELITKRLQKEGILFVTAAGNLDPVADEIAMKLYGADPEDVITSEELRNLEIHHFYPANLSRAYNNVITATTTDGAIVSPRQNFSNELVDIGVLADDKTKMSFKVPFETISGLQVVPGSSFATAIATGIIGAYCPANIFRSYAENNNVKKHKILSFLKNLPVDQLGKINTSTGDFANKYIKEGAWCKRTS